MSKLVNLINEKYGNVLENADCYGVVKTLSSILNSKAVCIFLLTLY